MQKDDIIRIYYKMTVGTAYILLKKGTRAADESEA
jgi:hypothetical protein